MRGEDGVPQWHATIHVLTVKGIYTILAASFLSRENWDNPRSRATRVLKEMGNNSRIWVCFRRGRCSYTLSTLNDRKIKYQILTLSIVKVSSITPPAKLTREPTTPSVVDSFFDPVLIISTQHVVDQPLVGSRSGPGDLVCQDLVEQLRKLRVDVGAGGEDEAVSLCEVMIHRSSDDFVDFVVCLIDRLGHS